MGGERKSDVTLARGGVSGLEPPGPRECLSRFGVGVVCLGCCSVSLCCNTPCLYRLVPPAGADLSGHIYTAVWCIVP